MLSNFLKGPRAQADRDLYKKYMLETLESTPNLFIKEGTGMFHV